MRAFSVTIFFSPCVVVGSQRLALWGWVRSCAEWRAGRVPVAIVSCVVWELEPCRGGVGMPVFCSWKLFCLKDAEENLGSFSAVGREL